MLHMVKEGMRVITQHIRDDQDTFLRKIPGSKAEHIRRAIDDYIAKLRKTETSNSLSGEQNNG